MPAPTPYLDFEIEIGPGDGRTYPVAVLRSPAGEAKAELTWPFSELQLEKELLRLKVALLGSGRPYRKAVSGNEQIVQKFGAEIFNAIFVDDVREAYAISRREAANNHTRLRIKLRIEAPELATLPWELLYSPRDNEYLSRSSSLTFVRYASLLKPNYASPPKAQGFLRILAMTANPLGMVNLDIEAERRNMEGALESLINQGLVELVWLQGQTWEELQQAMTDGPWHIFHFIGHGSYDSASKEGWVVLADQIGQPSIMTATQMGEMLRGHQSLHLAVFNSCEGAKADSEDVFSGIATTLMRVGIPAVLAMQFEITDMAAKQFAKVFYQMLAKGEPIDMAVVEARKSISLADDQSMEWGTPVLYMRSDDGRIFDADAISALHPPPDHALIEGVAPPPSQAANSAFPRRWMRWGGLAAAVVALVVTMIFWPNVGGNRGDPTKTPTFGVPVVPSLLLAAAQPAATTTSTSTYYYPVVTPTNMQAGVPTPVSTQVSTISISTNTPTNKPVIPTTSMSASTPTQRPSRISTNTPTTAPTSKSTITPTRVPVNIATQTPIAVATMSPGFVTSQPLTLTVSSIGGDFVSIQDAIDAAVTGTIILVNKGIYRENLIITRPVHIIGTGDRESVLIAGSHTDMIRSTTITGTLRNLALTHRSGGSGVNGIFIGGGSILIEDCTITSRTGNGIDIGYGATPVIRNNFISGSLHSGIHVWGNSTPLVEANVISENEGDGIHIRERSEGNYFGNHIRTNADDGVEVAAGSKPAFQDNWIYSNRDDGVVVTGKSTEPDFYRNYVRSNGGIGVFVTDDAFGEFLNNDISANSGTGVSIQKFANPDFLSNQIYENLGDGVYFGSDGKGRLEDNDIYANGNNQFFDNGIELSSATPNEVINNRITRNIGYGIYFSRSFGTFIGNTVTNNSRGAEYGRDSNIIWVNNAIE